MFLEYQPDLILLDLQMPYLNGFEVMKQLRGRCTARNRFFPFWY
jgi:CheY-like chemotaxis protein